jgi:hypothetical protein
VFRRHRMPPLPISTLIRIGHFLFVWLGMRHVCGDALPSMTRSSRSLASALLLEWSPVVPSDTRMSSVQDAAPDSSSLIFDPRLVKVHVLSVYSGLRCIIIIVPNVEFRTGMEVHCLELISAILLATALL